MHCRVPHALGGKNSLEWVKNNLDENATEFISKGKHKYIFVFDKRLRKQWLKQHQPYPKKRSEMNGE